VKVRLYVEGGPKNANAAGFRSFRTSFKQHLAKLHPSLNTLEVSPCGSTEDTIRDYARAIQEHQKNCILALLVDADSPVAADSPALHVQTKLDAVHVPAKNRENAFLMVQCMEAWLVTDLAALERCLGRRAKETEFPKNPDIEAVSKNDLMAALNKAAENTPTRRYHKIRDGAKILAELDPARVAGRSRHARLLHEFLRNSVHA
jgi:hypothetical protein